jgi:hypothetical protein
MPDLCGRESRSPFAPTTRVYPRNARGRTTDGARRRRIYGDGMVSAILNLNGRAGFLHWHAFQISVPNLIVIVLMLVVFGVALLAPFPGSRRRGSGRS